MKRLPELRPTLWDAAAAALILALAAGCGFLLRGAPGDETAVVTINGQEVDRFSLADSPGERVYSANGYTLTVEAAPDGVRVAAADCPTQDCVRTGRICRSGQSAVCLPARFILRLTGGEEPRPEVDAVIG